MQSKRKHERYTVEMAGVNGSMVLAKHLKIVNISLGGICVQTEKRLNIGSQYTIKLEGKGKRLNVKGAVIWSKLKESVKDLRGDFVPIYMAGMKFVHAVGEEVKEIVDFIEDQRQEIDKRVDLYASSGLRIFVRICIEDPERALLDYHYKVKNLSLGGMLMESAHELEIESRLPMEMTLAEGKTVRFMGRVVFCRETDSGVNGLYDIGINFLEMLEQDKVILSEFIATLEDG